MAHRKPLEPIYVAGICELDPSQSDLSASIPERSSHGFDDSIGLLREAVVHKQNRGVFCRVHHIASSCELFLTNLNFRPLIEHLLDSLSHELLVLVAVVAQRTLTNSSPHQGLALGVVKIDNQSKSDFHDDHPFEFECAASSGLVTRLVECMGTRFFPRRLVVNFGDRVLNLLLVLCR
jgi:hypothetical protein